MCGIGDVVSTPERMTKTLRTMPPAMRISANSANNGPVFVLALNIQHNDAEGVTYGRPFGAVDLLKNRERRG